MMNLKEEFGIKRGRLEQLMDRHGLRALVLQRQDNFAWLSCGGNGAVTVYTELACASLLITRDGDNYVVTDNIEADRLLDEQNLGELGFKPLIHPWGENRRGELIAKRMGSLDGIGSDWPGDYADLSEEIVGCRVELTESERERYMFLGKNLSMAVESCMLSLRPGVSEGEATGTMAARLWEHRIDLVTILVAFDDRVRKYRHPVTVNRRLERFAMLSVNARYQGLIATITRLGHVGEVGADYRELYANTVMVECLMINKTVPGALERDVLQTAVDAYAACGYPGEEKKHHQGGSMGYQSRDSIATPGSTKSARMNQAYCWNPTITGSKSEDGFIVGKSGPVFITGPAVFPTLDVKAEGVSYTRPGIAIL